MSLRSSLWRYLGLLAVAALAVGALAGPASAKKMSAKQRAAVRAQLKKQVKKNPAVVNRKSFIKRASLVNFKLPVTLRLRGSDTNNNPNRANIDLGASLGTREVDLGGKLAAEIVFHDSYDGGALGNVDLAILPSSTKSLTSTSIPLLWNSQVTQAGTRYDSNQLGLPSAASGCGNFVGNSPLPFGNGLAASGVVGGIPQPGGLPGFPYFGTLGDAGAGNVGGFLPVTPGVDSVDAVQAQRVPGVFNNVGGNPNPFPAGASSPISSAPTAQDTVLRTAPLNLSIAQAGTPVDQSTNVDGVAGSQNIVIGKSGGQANLFGNIPGKSYGIDVTVNLATKINSILRVVDQDSFGSPLITGDRYPAGIFNCRQIWTGAVQNYIPSVRLTGGLKIAPGITSDGHLRIAKATVSSQAGSEARFAVAACLAPYSGVDAEQNASDTTDSGIPAPTAGGPTLANTADLPANTGAARPAPAAACNAQPTELVRDSGLSRDSVNVLNSAATANGYTVNNSGSTVSVAADLSVQAVSIDVLIGDV